LIQQLSSFDDSIKGIIHFSPLVDLKNGIHDDFVSTAQSIAENFHFQIDLNSFKKFVEQYLPVESVPHNVPQLFLIGSEDDCINVEYASTFFKALQQKQKSVLTTILSGATHKLDTIYGHAIVRNQVMAFALNCLLSSHFEKIEGLYLWGSTLSKAIHTNTSDLDIIIIIKNFSYDFQNKINEFVTAIETKICIKIDLIIVSEAEIKSNKVIRRNRGPGFIDSLRFVCFPLKKYQSLPDSKFSLDDYGNIFYSVIYESRKILQNFRNTKPQIETIIKGFILNIQNYFLIKNRIYRLDELITFLHKNNHEASVLLHQAIKIKPDYAEAYYNRGVFKANLGDKQGAITDFNQVAQLFSQQGNMEMYLKALDIIKNLEK
jgi:tetratricopeptide (TPR) repeat protein